MIVGIVVVLALIIGGAAYFIASDSEEAAAGEVFLEPATDPGPDPFTTDIPVADAPELPSRPAGASLAGASTSSSVATSSTTAAGTTAVPSASGGTPGLYGGTQDSARCDPAQLKAFLAGDQAKAAAWVAAQNADPSFRWSGAMPLTVADLGAYIDTLTPITLITDTRVTNHGFANGQPTPRAAVLQAGTAVLVDELGVPRAKCSCGNPLAAPTPVKGEVTYTGNRWDGFDPQVTVVVQPTTVVIENIILVDIYTGDPFSRPAGTTGDQDVFVDPASIAGDVVEGVEEPQPATTETTLDEVPPPSVLTSRDFCGALIEYATSDLPDTLDESAFIDWATAAFDDLVSLAPPDIRPDVIIVRDAFVTQTAFTPEAEAADDRWYQWTITNCGFDWNAD